MMLLVCCIGGDQRSNTRIWYGGGAHPDPVIDRGERKARTRVVAFLTVFVAVGLISK